MAVGIIVDSPLADADLAALMTMAEDAARLRGLFEEVSLFTKFFVIEDFLCMFQGPHNGYIVVGPTSDDIGHLHALPDNVEAIRQGLVASCQLDTALEVGRLLRKMLEDLRRILLATPF